ncbi:TonB-dependent receptor [Thiocystis violacea]|nr:TonB-dependent receptor [Thiocystis violacea]
MRAFLPYLGPARILLTGALFLALSQAVSGATESTADPERDDLLTLLEGETRLATKSGMNADFVPGIVTILTGEDLLTRGARTVWDSISLVPGMSQGLEMTGERLILSRGVGHGYASGNVKLMLDGVSMNSSLTATANVVLNIPIEQVERIEVIRGPGSSVHGEYAYAGVVNVITRQHERRVHLQAGEAADHGLGTIWSWSDPKRDLSLSMNLMGLEGEGGVDVDQDALSLIGESALSNAPGESNEAHRYQAAFGTLRWRDVLVDLKLLQDDYGDHFGINHFLPPSDHNLASRHRVMTARVGRDLRLSEGLEARIRLDLLRQERDRDRLYVFPASYLADTPIYMNQEYQETRYGGSADVFWRPTPEHEWLFGLELSQVEIDQASWDWSGFPAEIPENWLDTEHDRTIVGLVAQDQYRPRESVTLTGTLRYDDYSDAGSMLSPRAAAVWRIDETNILKFQYARAFRPPTFYELEYAAEASLEASEIATYELGYILAKPRWDARLTLFHSDLTEPILFDEEEEDGYVNGQDARLRGVELEYGHRLGASLKVDANLSYVDATYPATDTTLSGGARLLGNLALTWRPHERWTAALQFRYVGERHRAESQQREDLEAYGLLDLTLGYRTPVKGLYLNAGIKNLADSQVHYPDIITSYGGVDLIYPDGYPRLGRRWWLSVGYAF